MGSITATTQPQGVFLDGQQPDTIITNDGPGTLYIDDNSSVSDESMSLPATGTMVWSGGQPLWVVSGDTSRVRLTRNRGLAVNNAAVYQVLYRNAAMSTVNGAAASTPQVECSAYNSLHIVVEDPTASAPSPVVFTEYITLSLDWYDRDGNNVATDVLAGWRETINTLSITTPVRGYGVVVRNMSVFGAAGGGGWGVSLIGTSRTLRPSWDHAGGNGGWLADFTGEFGTAYGAKSNWNGAAILLNGFGTRMSISVRNSIAAGGTGGDVRIHTRTGVQLGRIFIPAGTAAATVTEEEFLVTPSLPIYIAGTIDAANANYQLTWKWEDYNS